MKSVQVCVLGAYYKCYDLNNIYTITPIYIDLLGIWFLIRNNKTSEVISKHRAIKWASVKCWSIQQSHQIGLCV